MLARSVPAATSRCGQNVQGPAPLVLYPNIIFGNPKVMATP